MKSLLQVNKIGFILIALLPCFSLFAQQPGVVKEINSINTREVALAPLRYLASDELKGRATMRPEINIAAKYISDQFRKLGVKEVAGTKDYFQPFNITMLKPATTGTFTVNDKSFSLGKDLVQLKGKDFSANAPVVYAGHGMKEDVETMDIKGNIVITEMGANDSSSFMDGFYLIKEKQKILQQKGAIAVIERYKQDNFPWAELQKYLAQERPADEEDNSDNIPVFMINDQDAQMSLIKNNPATGVINITGTTTTNVAAKNVLGWVEGTDAKLKDQFIVLTAHYDHLGVAKQPAMENGKLDSIYNGARDNAIGTAAVIDAARYFTKHPAKRSVLFIAYTAEEIGEIGSKYFAAHPAIPLNKLVYNLNIDNASYNDTTIVSVIGLGRTSADDDIKKACAAYGLTAMPDPVPEQNLFDRSDNTQLAVKGIPAPTFSLGIKKFDEEIMKRYHQLSDEVGDFNLNYAMKYIKSFILAARYIADNPKQPEWVKGDKYEEAWKKLYGKATSFR
ncbi:MAG: putative aminopeptidase [Segetibacter sp.]|nr:putative aminopeptidase [Segetibacter sp.]